MEGCITESIVGKKAKGYSIWKKHIVVYQRTNKIR